MRLCSITVTSDREAIIGDAIRSVEPWVDVVLIVDIGITGRTLEIVKEIAGEKVAVVKASGNMADMRNAGLEEAERLGCDWAVQLDTDERILLNGCDIRASLSSARADTLLVMHDDGHFMRDRFFRLPANRYQFHAHESYISTNGVDVLEDVRFHELPKTQEQIEKRVTECDIPYLLQQIKAEPNNPRWAYYLGSSYEHIKKYDKAIKLYHKCASMKGSAERGGWACYRAAVCRDAMGDRERAIAECVRGMGICPGLAELPWFAGVECLALGRPLFAIFWANMAMTLGYGSKAFSMRLGFRAPQGLFEGPYEVLEHAYRILGASEAVPMIHADVERMRVEKERWMKGGA